MQTRKWMFRIFCIIDEIKNTIVGFSKVRANQCFWKIISMMVFVVGGICFNYDYSMAQSRHGNVIQQHGIRSAEWSSIVENITSHVNFFDVPEIQGALNIRMGFDISAQQILFTQRNLVNFGAAYGFRLSERVSLKARAVPGYIYLYDITGIAVLAKIPLVSDRVYIKEIRVDINTGETYVSARALGGVVPIMARGNMRLREFDGAEWFMPLIEAIPELFSTVNLR
jgi:hypothetical protein